jgi:hypothetical protein
MRYALHIIQTVQPKFDIQFSSTPTDSHIHTAVFDSKITNQNVSP